MALPTFTTNTTALAADATSIVSHLQGGSGKTEAWHFRASTSNDILMTLSDAAGARKFSVRDSAGVEIFSIDSDGNMTLAGTFVQSTMVFPTGATPTQTTEGSVKWDTDDDVITVGDGATTKRFGYIGSTVGVAEGVASAGSGHEMARANHVHPRITEAKETAGGASIESVTWTTAFSGTPIVACGLMHTEAAEVVVNARSTTGATMESFDIGASPYNGVKMAIARMAS